VQEEQRGGFSCCQWQPQLSKKRDFFPSMLHHEHVPYSLRNREQGERNKRCPRPDRSRGHDRGTDRNRRASVSLSPTLALFLAPQGKLYLRLQERVPGSERVRLAASPPPKTMTSHIAIPDAVPSSYRFSNGYPK
jgi:hypothetical protein